MLSIVLLLAGGGSSAPKHVDQFLAEGHLRWDFFSFPTCGWECR